MTQFKSSSLKLIQDCFADASKASIGRHVVEGDFTGRRYSSNTNDRRVFRCNNDITVWIGNPRTHIMGCIIAKPFLQNDWIVLVIGMAKLSD